jgi:hypothetical protein
LAKLYTTFDHVSVMPTIFLMLAHVLFCHLVSFCFVASQKFNQLRNTIKFAIKFDSDCNSIATRLQLNCNSIAFARALCHNLVESTTLDNTRQHSTTLDKNQQQSTTINNSPTLSSTFTTFSFQSPLALLSTPSNKIHNLRTFDENWMSLELTTRKCHPVLAC